MCRSRFQLKVFLSLPVCLSVCVLIGPESGGFPLTSLIILHQLEDKMKAHTCFMDFLLQVTHTRTCTHACPHTHTHTHSDMYTHTGTCTHK